VYTYLAKCSIGIGVYSRQASYPGHVGVRNTVPLVVLEYIHVLGIVL